MIGKEMIGKYVVVRGDRSGIFAGTLKEKEQKQNGYASVILTDCRRLWQWSGACSISQIAIDGTKEPNNCKFTVTVDSIELSDAIEIIPCTERATEIIKGVAVWKIKS